MCNPQKSSVNVCLMKILKSTVAKKNVIVCFFNLCEEKFLKLAAFVIFLTSVMDLFEIHQRVKGYFLNELHVSFKNKMWENIFCIISFKVGLKSTIFPWNILQIYTSLKKIYLNHFLPKQPLKAFYWKNRS